MDNMQEIWKDLPGFEGLYQVSSLGNVMSLNFGGKIGKKRVLKLVQHGRGYRSVLLYKDGIRTQRLVHRLVAETFIPNPSGLPQVNHKDENKENNCVENLEWCNNQYNNIYSHAKQVYCVELNRLFECSSIAHEETGIHRCCILQCCEGLHKTAGGYHWRFVKTA